MPDLEAGRDLDLVPPAEAEDDGAPARHAVVVDPHARVTAASNEQTLGKHDDIRASRGLDVGQGALTDGPPGGKPVHADVDLELTGLRVGPERKSHDASGERCARVGVERHAHGLPRTERPDRGFVDPRGHPHVVRRDDVDDRAPGDDHVTGLAVTLDDESIERCHDPRVAESLLEEPERPLRAPHGPLTLHKGELGELEIGEGDVSLLRRALQILEARDLLLRERLDPLERGSKQLLVGLGTLDARGGAVDARLGDRQLRPRNLDLLAQVAVVERGEELSARDPVALVDDHAREPAGDSRPDRGPHARRQGPHAQGLLHDRARHDRVDPHLEGSEEEPVEAPAGYSGERCQPDRRAKHRPQARQPTAHVVHVGSTFRESTTVDARTIRAEPRTTAKGAACDVSPPFAADNPEPARIIPRCRDASVHERFVARTAFDPSAPSGYKRRNVRANLHRVARQHVRTTTLLLVCAALAAGRGRAEDLVCWRITSAAPRISEATSKRPFDTFGAPDWGLCIRGASGEVAVVPLGENGGTAFVEVLPSDALSAHLVDIDPTGLERASDDLELALAAGERPLRFSEGSTVVLRIARFEPDQASGADARPAGARPLRAGVVAAESVSMVKADRTDHWALELSAESWVCGIMSPGQIQADWLYDASTTPFGTAMNTHDRYTLFQGRLPKGKHVLRVRAQPTDREDVPYRLFIDTAPEPGKHDRIVRFLTDDARALPSWDYFDMDAAASVLATLDTKAVRSQVLSALGDSSAAVRFLGLRTVRKLRMTEYQSSIEQMAQADPNALARKEAGRILEEWRRRK